MLLSPGERLGSYEIIALIGSGSMGEVYKARDVPLGRSIALKVLSSRDSVTSSHIDSIRARSSGRFGAEPS